MKQSNTIHQNFRATCNSDCHKKENRASKTGPWFLKDGWHQSTLDKAHKKYISHSPRAQFDSSFYRPKENSVPSMGSMCMSKKKIGDSKVDIEFQSFKRKTRAHWKNHDSYSHNVMSYVKRPVEPV